MTDLVLGATMTVAILGGSWLVSRAASRGRSLPDYADPDVSDTSPEHFLTDEHPQSGSDR